MMPASFSSTKMLRHRHAGRDRHFLDDVAQAPVREVVGCPTSRCRRARARPSRRRRRASRCDTPSRAGSRLTTTTLMPAITPQLGAAARVVRIRRGRVRTGRRGRSRRRSTTTASANRKQHAARLPARLFLVGEEIHPEAVMRQASGVSIARRTGRAIAGTHEAARPDPCMPLTLYALRPDRLR